MPFGPPHNEKPRCVGHPAVNCTGVNLTNYNMPAGKYTLYVEAVGVAGITNWLSKGLAYSQP